MFKTPTLGVDTFSEIVFFKLFNNDWLIIMICWFDDERDCKFDFDWPSMQRLQCLIIQCYPWDLNLILAEHIRMVDFEINPWSSLFLNLEINPWSSLFLNLETKLILCFILKSIVNSTNQSGISEAWNFKIYICRDGRETLFNKKKNGFWFVCTCVISVGLMFDWTYISLD